MRVDRRWFHVVVVVVGVLAPVVPAGADVFLPGTQPEEAGITFGKVRECMLCHSETANGPADPFFSWQGGMMAQAARDPVFRAALAIANQDVPGIGEYCLRCHAPRAWLEGRSSPPDGSLLDREDLHGVTCDVCHRLVDPISKEAAGLVEHLPPGYGNAMVVADPTATVRGPYGDGDGTMPHGTVKSSHIASSELCATCHTVSNPLQATDVRTQPPHAYGHIERTYSEWALSAFADPVRGRTCQSCHYPPVEGGGRASRLGGPHRDHFVMHGPVGGSTWVQDATVHVWGRVEAGRRALSAGKKRARALLRTAARLELDFEGADRATVRVVNLSGHKLPTGYPEGRRMWLNVRVLGDEGQVLDEVGRYGETTDTVLGREVTVPTLLDPDRARVWECLPGLSDEQAARHGKAPGVSFHFILNDVIVKDNRIPPEGFSNEAFAGHLCAPVGAAYADGQHWDDVEIPLPEGTIRVEARLMFQSVSWEYIKFLAEENRSDDWGRRLLDAWEKTGQCPPEMIAQIAADVVGDR